MSDKSEEQPAPFDIGGEHRPDDVVVSFDKINEITLEKKAAKTQKAEQPASEKTGRGRSPKTDKPAKESAPPPEPREAPRSGKKEEIVYIKLSELHPCPVKTAPTKPHDTRLFSALLRNMRA